MAKEKCGSTTLGSAWGNPEGEKWLDCPKSSGAGYGRVLDIRYDVLCKFGLQMASGGLQESGSVCVCLSGRISVLSV